MLTVVSAAEILAFSLEPVDDRVGVLLYRRCEDYQIVPLAHLQKTSESKLSSNASFHTTDLPEKLVTMWSFVYIVQDRDLRSVESVSTYWPLNLDLNHMTGAHSAAFGHTVYKRLIQIND